MIRLPTPHSVPRTTTHPHTPPTLKGIGGGVGGLRGANSHTSHTFPTPTFQGVGARPCHCCGEAAGLHYKGLLGCRVGRSFYRPALVLGLAS
jgi:hypothetical protein